MTDKEILEIHKKIQALAKQGGEYTGKDYRYLGDTGKTATGFHSAYDNTINIPSNESGKKKTIYCSCDSWSEKIGNSTFVSVDDNKRTNNREFISIGYNGNGILDCAEMSFKNRNDSVDYGQHIKESEYVKGGLLVQLTEIGNNLALRQILNNILAEAEQAVQYAQKQNTKKKSNLTLGNKTEKEKTTTEKQN